MSEQDLFNRFKERPCRDALVGVLRASQDRIYGLCFRILRRHEDAEDASQKVLLRLLDLVGELKDGEHYTRMVSRLALFVALDEARARSTRRAHERRKCEMRSDGSVPELPEDVTPLYSHLGRLDERSRDLIVDHYLEGRSLETIARRLGCSKVAVWKRLEKVRAALRLSLAGAGLSALVAGMESVLEAAPLAPAPRDLVTSSMIEKAARVTAAGTGPSPPTLGTGGMIMAGKGVSSAVGIAVLLIALLGGGALLCFRRADPPEAAVAEARKLRKPPLTEAATGSVAKDARLGENEAAAVSKARGESLANQLKAFRELVLTARKGNSGELYMKMSSESEQLHAEVLAHPAEYLAFLRGRENEDVLDDLTNIVFVRYAYRRVDGVVTSVGDGEMLGAASKVPREILDGVFELAKTGSGLQRVAALSVLPSRDSSGRPNRTLMELCTRLLNDPNPSVAAAALGSIRDGDPECLREHTDDLARLLEILRLGQGWENSTDIHQCLMALASVDTEQSDVVLSKTLEGALETYDHVTLGILDTVLYFHRRSFTADVADRTAPLLSSALRTTSNPNEFGTLLGLSLTLPLQNATPILESALPFAPKPEVREGLEETLKKIRKGERGVVSLRETLEKRPNHKVVDR